MSRYHAATATERATLAKGRETMARNRADGVKRMRTFGSVRTAGEPEPGVKPSPGRNFTCPNCGETLSWPGRSYTCPKGGRGWIDTRAPR